ncbi:hypothetical protein NQ318_011078 [Aromia moschata]|uniref:NADP-dependent oxidoreductase domain-containing protein n=1 Tax=Aromia moschata TaxID=1265417 RepID=A0AAV8YTS3_9CUCU|nr:hypothetical protein NQ318_011078 [Aromia moschata]
MELPETFVPGFHDEDEVRKMKYNDLGRTGLRVSQLSLGTGGFSTMYSGFDIEECKKTCLEGIPRKAYYIATKVGRYEKDPPNLRFNFTAEKTKESVETSLRRLRVDYVDIIQVHDIEFAPSLDIVLNETLPTLDKIVKQGKANFIGVTGYPISKLWECIQASTIKINTVLSYCRLTMFDNTLKTYIPNFKAKHLGIICAAANSMGLLSSLGPPDWHPAVKEIRDVCSEAREYCKEKGVELGKLAVYYTLQQEGPDTVLVGMNSVKYLTYNLDVVYNGLSRKEKDAYEEVLKILSKMKQTHWENVEVEAHWKALKGQ